MPPETEKVVKGDDAAASAAFASFDDPIPQNGTFPSRNGRAGDGTQSPWVIVRFHSFAGPF